MTVKEYNKEFLPQINGAKTFVNALDHIIEKVFAGDGMLFCAGSLYLIGDIKAIINSQTVHKH